MSQTKRKKRKLYINRCYIFLAQCTLKSNDNDNPVNLTKKRDFNKLQINWH